jgi:hypothetical protein
MDPMALTHTQGTKKKVAKLTAPFVWQVAGADVF